MSSTMLCMKVTLYTQQPHIYIKAPYIHGELAYIVPSEQGMLFQRFQTFLYGFEKTDGTQSVINSAVTCFWPWVVILCIGVFCQKWHISSIFSKTARWKMIFSQIILLRITFSSNFWEKIMKAQLPFLRCILNKEGIALCRSGSVRHEF